MATSPRTVVTLATIPGRIEFVIPVLEKLLAQRPDRLYLWIPRLLRRTGEPGAIPPELMSFQRRNPLLHVEMVEDLGPITKLLPVLEHEPDPETRIVVTDDDSLVRHPAWLSGLVENLGPLSAVGYSGFRFLKTAEPWRPLITSRHLAEVEVLEGWCGYALLRGWLDHGLAPMVRSFANAWDEHLEILCVDDLIVSGYLRRVGVTARVLFDSVHRFNAVDHAPSHYRTSALHLRNGGVEANAWNTHWTYTRLLRLIDEHCAAGAAAA